MIKNALNDSHYIFFLHKKLCILHEIFIVLYEYENRHRNC